MGSSVPAVPGLPSLDTAMFTEGRKTVRLTTNFEEEDDMAFFGKDKKQDGDKAPEKKAQTPPAPETPPAETPAAKPEPEAGSTASLTQGGDDKTVKLSQEVAELRVQNAALAAKMKTKEIQAFTDGLTKEGKLPPGLNTPALHAFMASLSEGDGEKVVKFTDGEGKPQAAGQLALFKDFLSALPVLVTKGHMFTSELAGNVQGEHPEDRAGDAIAKAGGLPA